MKKHLLSVISLLAVMTLAGCGESKNSTSTSDKGTSSPIADSSSVNQPAVKELKSAYLSPAVMSYMNMRPAYNYYLTTYSFEYLETFTDDSYILTVSSTTFSGLNLPDEGNNATGNERTNYIAKFYGAMTSKTNELDEDSLDVSLNIPTRLIMSYDSTYFADTANWTESMTENTAIKAQDGTATKSFANGGEYLAYNAFSKKEVTVSKATNSFDYFNLREKDEVNPSVNASEGDALQGSFISPATLTYMNMRPAYNYYMTIMNQEGLELIDEDDYVLTILSSDFSGVTLPNEGNNATGSDRANYALKFYGKYTSITNELDEDTLDVTVKAPDKVTLAYDAKYFVSSDNFDDKAKSDTAIKAQDGTVTKEYNNGAEYLASFAVKETTISVTKTTSSFDYAEITAQLH
ncbi:MAG: hypothetical protein WCS80_03705 [Bacilli bacterium]